MLVSVIIINYNTFRLTCDCIDSVLKYTKDVAYEVVLVDNASPNDNPDDFTARFGNAIKLVKSKDNTGFAGGNNMGIAHANGDVILLLNSDTMLTEDSISIAAKELQKDSSIGALGVRLTYTDGKLQHTARKFRSIKNELLDLARPVLKLLPYRKRADLMLNQYFRGNYNTNCDWVSGAFMMFRKELLQQLPGNKLDERFFMYGEDQLWCYQFQQLGYHSRYIADTTVIHIHNASTSPEKQLQLLKKMLELELQIMEYRVGKGIYYYIFKLIFSTKERFRYFVKVAVEKIFDHRLR